MSPRNEKDVEKVYPEQRCSSRRSVFRRLTVVLGSLLAVGFVLNGFFFKMPVALGPSFWKDDEMPNKDLQLRQCVDLGEEPRVHFELPLSSSPMLLFSRGAYSVGEVSYAQSDEYSGVVAFDVEVHSDWDFEEDLVKVCSASRRSEEPPTAIGIFTPSWRHGRTFRQISFDVKVTLPGSASAPLRLSDFTVYTPLFSHKFGDLSAVFFNSLTLETSLGHITAEALDVGVAKLTNTNGAISGSYSATNLLELRTSNGEIKVDVDLNNLDAETPSSLDLKTHTGSIKAATSLASANTTGGNFHVSARSDVGAVALEFPSAPESAKQVIEARAEVGTVKVMLHESYEGSFDVRTMMGSASLDYDHFNKHQNGRRIFARDSNPRAISGYVKKVEGGVERGSVRLRTKIGSASLAP